MGPSGRIISVLRRKHLLITGKLMLTSVWLKVVPKRLFTSNDSRSWITVFFFLTASCGLMQKRAVTHFSLALDRLTDVTRKQ